MLFGLESLILLNALRVDPEELSGSVGDFKNELSLGEPTES